jgi:hypothetical protein
MARAPRGPERPNAAKGDQRSLDAMDLEIGHPGHSLCRRTMRDDALLVAQSRDQGCEHRVGW